MVDFITSQSMVGTYFYLLGCILAKVLLKHHLDTNDPKDKYIWVLSLVCVVVLITTGFVLIITRFVLIIRGE